MKTTTLSFYTFELEVSFYNDGEPHEILHLDEDVQHLFTPSACGEIYSRAWEQITDPANEADFRYEEYRNG